MQRDRLSGTLALKFYSIGENMEYLNNYKKTLSLADQLREAAQSGKSARVGLGAPSGGRKKSEQVLQESIDKTNAKYVSYIQDFFSKVKEEKAKAIPKEEELPPNVPLSFGGDVPKVSRKVGEFAAFGKGSTFTERDLLAITLQAEAGGEGEIGMLAAGSVIANRVSKGFGDSLSDVILAPGQFSAWNSLTGYAGGEGGLDMTNMKASKEAYAVADAIISGNYESPVGDATHYYNPDVATPKWGKQAGGEWKTIGNHIFGKAK